jgi:hypothetical protein
MTDATRTSRDCVLPFELMEKINRALKFYATYGSWHYSDREMRAPPRACSAQDRRPLAIIDGGKAAGEVYAELVKLYPLPQSAVSETADSVDAARFRALLVISPTITHPCRPPLSNGGWHGRLRGTWGSTGIFGATLTEFVDRVIGKLKQHPDSKPDVAVPGCIVNSVPTNEDPPNLR